MSTASFGRLGHLLRWLGLTLVVLLGLQLLVLLGSWNWSEEGYRQLLMDKAWAEEAGMGWIGKHGNLIHRRRGSWLLLGHLLTSLDLPADTPAEPLCGSCSRCLPACPTGAISEPFVVDSRRCLAFHTIENRDPELPTAIAGALEGWVAGCDICQEVCPWNDQPLESSDDPDLQPRPWLLDLRAEEALHWSDATWDERLRASALRRLKPWMWRRNLRASQGGTA